MELVHFPSQVGGHPSGHVPGLGASVEASFAYKDLAPSSQRAYRAALGPLVDAVWAAQPLAAVTPTAVSELFTERWSGSAAATWNVRRAAVRAFVSWSEDRWPFGVDPLALAGTRTRTLRSPCTARTWTDRRGHRTEPHRSLWICRWNGSP